MKVTSMTVRRAAEVDPAPDDLLNRGHELINQDKSLPSTRWCVYAFELIYVAWLVYFVWSLAT